MASFSLTEHCWMHCNLVPLVLMALPSTTLLFVHVSLHDMSSLDESQCKLSSLIRSLQQDALACLFGRLSLQFHISALHKPSSVCCSLVFYTISLGISFCACLHNYRSREATFSIFPYNIYSLFNYSYPGSPSGSVHLITSPLVLTYYHCSTQEYPRLPCI